MRTPFVFMIQDLHCSQVPFTPKTSPDAIVQSAAELVRAEGLGALSMRTLAAPLGLRASSLYRHFPDRASIEAAVAQQAGQLLYERLERAVGDLTGKKALFASAHAYLQFATSERAFYDVLMDPNLPNEQSQFAGKPVWNMLLRIVGEITGIADNTSGAVAVWSFLHGYVTLDRTGRFGPSGPQQGFDRGMQALVVGLGAALIIYAY